MKCNKCNCQIIAGHEDFFSCEKHGKFCMGCHQDHMVECIRKEKKIPKKILQEEIVCPYCGTQNKHPKDNKGHFEIDDDNFIMGCSECAKYFSVSCRRDSTIYLTECLQGDGMHKEIATLREEVIRLGELISEMKKHHNKAELLCHICGKDH